MDHAKLTEKVDLLRKQKGYTYKELGEYLGISGDAVRKAIKSKRLKLYYINRLSDLFGINNSDFHADHFNETESKVEETVSVYDKKSISLLEIRDDLKADLLDIKKNSAKKQHIQALSDSLAENFESISGALLKILEHNEKVEDFMDQIDLKALKEATKSLNK